MRAIIKYEVVRGRYEARDKSIREYENLKLYSLTVPDNEQIWHPTVKADSQYEQTVSCGGVRERTRQWVSRDSIGADKTGCAVTIFESVSIRTDQLQEFFGIDTVEDFEKVFMDEFFLHTITIFGNPKDYGRLEITRIDISAEPITSLIKKKNA